MLVSWTWLCRYLDLTVSPERLTDALSLSGLNHEETIERNGETVIDLEVTSNRGDCLGHIGVAREISVLFDLPLTIPTPELDHGSGAINDLLTVRNEDPENCQRYTARVIEGCQVGPSPQWLTESLEAIGINSVNNVVDITNYVMMECGQPLHAFDLELLEGASILIRRAGVGESIQAIDHREYPLDEEICVIADAAKPIAVAGVMGGAECEVTETTSRIVIESAIFKAMNVRQTARKLKLHSPSSYRFERRVDPAGVDWASRRACQLILQIAGGKLVSGAIDTQPEIPPRPPIILRIEQVERILGIHIPESTVCRILSALGCQLETTSSLAVIPPSWRHDLTREADLIEEVARIHGYDKIPENSPIPVAPSAKRPFDVAMDRVRQTMVAAGISEAMTPSVVTEKTDRTLSPWSEVGAMQTLTPLLKGANRLRRSLVPSLLQCRADNWSASSQHADLYEVAHIYLSGQGSSDLPAEHYTLGIVAGVSFYELKGITESLLGSLGIHEPLRVTRQAHKGVDRDQSVALFLGQELVGYLGVIDRKAHPHLKLPGDTAFAELALMPLFERATLVPQFNAVSHFPTIRRDLNMVVSEQVSWEDLETSTRAAVGVELTEVVYRETYRDPEKDGRQTKRILFTLGLQRHNATLTGEEAEEMVEAVVRRCELDHGARLLA